ncbi:hypothetical protein, partial [Candidatus Thiosymbion oneisti]|uniref:hypothetical protein n=1 Tax=Candidatus Thiosymbion oneisti TaxID=589554 RepID=UPI001C402E48
PPGEGWGEGIKRMNRSTFSLINLPLPQSSMRLMSIIALVASIAFGSITMLSDEDSDKNDLYIVTVFLIAAFAPKAVQKFAEAKLPPKD